MPQHIALYTLPFLFIEGDHLKLLAHRADDARTVVIAQPPADRQTYYLVSKDIEPRQQHGETLYAGVQIISLVHCADCDAFLLHHRDEALTSLESRAKKARSVAKKARSMENYGNRKQHWLTSITRAGARSTLKE